MVEDAQQTQVIVSVAVTHSHGAGKSQNLLFFCIALGCNTWFQSQLSKERGLGGKTRGGQQRHLKWRWSFLAGLSLHNRPRGRHIWPPTPS